MIIVIIAGGSGTRLWPLSQADYPKHLLRLTGENSLLQNTYQRSRLLSETVYVITEASHADEVRKQLPDLEAERVIVEPARRGTASCFVLALATIQHQRQDDQPIVFMHADSYITEDESFVEAVRVAAEASEKHRRITMVGIQPNYPATGFGYIEQGGEVESHDGVRVAEVVRFKEKPNRSTAQKYLDSGRYVWNMGLFAAPPSVFLEAFTKYAPDLAEAYDQVFGAIGHRDDLEKAYLALENHPIDTALAERTPNLLVVGGRFNWADIGSFFDLHKLLKDKDSNALKGDIELIESDDVMVHGSDKPIVVIGLSGVVVVDSPDGLLVCAKEKSQLVGEAAKRLQKRAQEQT